MIMHNDKMISYWNNSLEDYYFLKDLMGGSSPKDREEEKWLGDGYVNDIRKDFPVLHRKVQGKPLIWLDNSATTQKPQQVITALSEYYSEYNSNIHRGAHTLAEEATAAYEGAREKVKNFMGAQKSEEIIFTRGTTEAINLVAQSYGDIEIGKGDEILVSIMEHHSNILPWKRLAEKKEASIKVIPMNSVGEIILEDYEKLFTPRTKIVAITHVSNVLGTINPVKTMIKIAHRHGAIVLVDGAQAVPHLYVDVSNLDADFYVFSGHKLYGPTGIGVLYGKLYLLEKMPPWQSGGGMIESVSFEKVTYNDLPYKFEAGTGNIGDAVALGVAIDYLKKVGMDSIERHEKKLTQYALEGLREIPGMELLGESLDKTSVISFILQGISPNKVARYLNNEGIALRSGHHCAQPVLSYLGVDSCLRASLGLYNSKGEIDSLTKSLVKIATYYS